MENFINSLSKSISSRPSSSLVRQVTEAIREEIIRGNWKPGSQLPSEDELCKALKVSRGTLRSALNNLDFEGMIVRRHGVGTFVRERLALQNNLNLLQGTIETIRSIGLTPGIAQISVVQEPASPDIANRLGRREGVSIIRVERVLTANDRKIVVTTDHFCASLLNRFQGGPPPTSMIQWYLLDHLSLFVFLEEGLGVKIHHSMMEMRPVNAPEQISKMLEIPADMAVMFSEEINYDIEEQPILYTKMYSAAEASIFSINRQR